MLKRITSEEYAELDVYSKDLVACNPEQAKTEVRQILAKGLMQFRLYVAFLVLLIVIGLGLIITYFDQGGIVFGGVVLMAVPTAVLLELLGILGLNGKPPYRGDYISRDDYPILFEALERITDELRVQKIDRVSLYPGRFMIFYPGQSYRKQPEWFLYIGDRFLLEAHKEELLAHLRSLIADIYSTEKRIYREVYNAMALHGGCPGLQQYWKAWLLAEHLNKKWDQKYAHEWSGSLQLRAILSAPLYEHAMNEFRCSYAHEDSDVGKQLQSYTAQYHRKQRVTQNLIERISREESSVNVRKFYESTFDLNSASERAAMITEVARKIEEYSGDSAFNAIIQSDSRSKAAFLGYFKSQEKSLILSNRLAGEIARDVLQDSLRDELTWTAEEYLALAIYQYTAESPSVSIRILEDGVQKYPDNPWLLIELLRQKLYQDYLSLPETISQFSQYPVLETSICELLAEWKWVFGDPPPELKLKTESTFSVGVDVQPSDLPSFYRESWAYYFKDIPEIERAYAFKEIDKKRNERMRIVAVLKTQNWRLRPEWFEDRVRQKLPKSGLIEVILVAQDHAWYRMLLRKHKTVLDRLI